MDAFVWIIRQSIHSNPIQLSELTGLSLETCQLAVEWREGLKSDTRPAAGTREWETQTQAFRAVQDALSEVVR